MHPSPVFAAGLCLALLPGLALAQGGAGVNVQADCAAYATQQTGFDPARPPPQAVADPRVAGTGARARGAAAGAMIGGISGNAGAGAATGAVAGGVTQRSRSRRAARQQNAAIADQQQAGRAAYDQAYSACLGGRGPAQ
jgi:hypothetical protein